MNNTNNLQNFPNDLDINSWLEYSLKSANEQDRQIALEEILANGFTPELKETLINVAKSDTSQNCRNKAIWILKLAETKPQLKSLIKQLDITPDYVFLQIQKGDYAKVYLCSQILRKSPSSKTLTSWRVALQNSNEPKIIETGLNILSKFGSDQDTPIAVKHLHSPNVQVVCAAFSFLAQKDVKTLKKYIKCGLSSKTASIVLHSIHLLRSIDEAESIKYLSNLILNKNALIRQKALRELLLIDFNKIQDFFWQYIGREEQPLLLVKAGFIVTINPNAAFPFKIYDIFSISNGIKKQIMQSILKQSIETTYAAGILGNKNIETFLEEIQRYINNKKAESLIRIAIANLKAPESDIRLSAVDTLSQYIAHPQIKGLLRAHLDTETDPSIKSLILSLFEETPDSDAAATEPIKREETVSTSETNIIKAVSQANEIKAAETTSATTDEKLQSFPEVKAFTKLTVKEQRSYLHKINTIDIYSLARKTLIDSVDFDLKKSVILEILRTIEKYGDNADAKQIQHLLKSKDNSVVAQTIKTIGAINLELIMLDLNRVLSNKDPRIKAAAFEVYIHADKTAAIQYVGTMLKQTGIGTRRIALSLMPQLDYPSAEPLLWWLLDHETTFELQEQAGYMVAANPTREGISRLYKFTHSKTGEIQPIFRDLWGTAIATSEQVFSMPAAEIEQQCFDILTNDLNQEGEDKIDYKYKAVMGKNDEIAAELESNPATRSTPFESALLFFNQYKLYIIIGVAVVGVVSVLSSLKPDENKINRENPKEVASEVNFIPSQGSDKTTQVGGDDWQGYSVSGARNILRSSNYAALIKSAVEESDKFREEAKIKKQEYYRQLANDLSADKDDREWAAANLNENYSTGNEAYESKDFKKAETYFERAVNDPSLSGYGRIDALQKLCEISDMRSDKKSWLRWMDLLMKEIHKTPEFATVDAFKNFGQTFEQLESVSQALKTNPAVRAEMKNGLREKYGMSEQEAEKAVEDLQNFKSPFD